MHPRHVVRESLSIQGTRKSLLVPFVVSFISFPLPPLRRHGFDWRIRDEFISFYTSIVWSYTMSVRPSVVSSPDVLCCKNRNGCAHFHAALPPARFMSLAFLE
jgi:hypothetical protein